MLTTQVVVAGALLRLVQTLLAQQVGMVELEQLLALAEALLLMLAVVVAVGKA